MQKIYSRVVKNRNFFLYFRVRGKAQHSDPPSLFIESPPLGSYIYNTEKNKSLQQAAFSNFGKVLPFTFWEACMSIITAVRCEGCFLLKRFSCVGCAGRAKFKGIINKTHNVSVNSKPDPPGRPQGFAHSCCPRGRVFAPLSCPGVCPGGS